MADQEGGEELNDLKPMALHPRIFTSTDFT